MFRKSVSRLAIAGLAVWIGCGVGYAVDFGASAPAATCGWSDGDPDDYGIVQGSCIGSFNVAVVYLTYPDIVATTSGTDELPSWAESLPKSVGDYLFDISIGQHTVQSDVVRRAAPDASKKWLMPLNSTAYSTNFEIVDAANDILPSGWDDGYDLRVYISDYYPSGAAAGEAFGGFVCSGTGSMFLGQGRIGSTGDWSEFFNLENTTGRYVHEYGHNLGFNHLPDADDDHFACYGAMQAALYDGCPVGTWRFDNGGFLPYHPTRLVSAGWITPTEIATSTTVTLRDVRTSGDVVTIPIDHEDYFMILNHQRTGLDDSYNGSGLLIWHINRENLIDLEHRDGKFVADPSDPDCPDDPAVADPVSGVDAIDCSGEMNASPFYKGVSFSFPGGPPTKEFAPETNPSTNAYEIVPFDQNSPQTVPTGIAIRNISSAADPQDPSKRIFTFDVLFE